MYVLVSLKIMYIYLIIFEKNKIFIYENFLLL